MSNNNCFECDKVHQYTSIEIGTVLIALLTIKVAIDIYYVFNDFCYEFHSNLNSSTNNKRQGAVSAQEFHVSSEVISGSNRIFWFEANLLIICHRYYHIIFFT